MEQFNTIPTSGNWSDIAGILDANFFRCYTALVQSESLVGLSGSNFQGIYASASTLPDVSSSSWALVGSSLSALTLYVYNMGSSEWGALNNVTYNFTDFSEFQNQLDALSSQIATISSKLGNLDNLVTNDKSSAVSAINNLLNDVLPTYRLKIIDNSYVNNTNGTILAYNGWSRTDYTVCKGLSTINVSNVTVNSKYNCFYDENKAFISSFTTPVGDSVIDVPTNAFYFIASNTTTAMNGMKIDKATITGVDELKNVLAHQDSPEYLFVLVDSAQKILLGITALESALNCNIPLKVGGVDVMDAIKAVKDSLNGQLSQKVDKVANQSLINSTFADGTSIVSNQEYLLAVTDSDGKILTGVDSEGNLKFNGIPNDILQFLIRNYASKSYMNDGISESNKITADKLEESHADLFTQYDSIHFDVPQFSDTNEYHEIAITSQEQFTKSNILSLLETSISQGYKNIVLSLPDGILTYENDIITLDGTGYSGINLHIVGHGTKLVSGGNIYEKANAESIVGGYYRYPYSTTPDLNTEFLDENLNSINMYSHTGFVKELAQTFDSANSIVKMKVDVDDDYVGYPSHIIVSRLWTRVVRTLLPVPTSEGGDGTVTLKNGYVYFVDVPISSTNSNWRVNSDSIIYNRNVRYQLFNAGHNIFIREGYLYVSAKFMKVYECSAKRFASVGSQFSSFLINGVSFVGSNTNVTISDDGTMGTYSGNISFHDFTGSYGIIRNCKFNRIKNQCISIDSSQNILIEDNCADEIYKNFVIINESENVYITHNVISNVGLHLNNGTAVSGKGTQILVSDNRFVNCNYIAISLGEWWGFHENGTLPYTTSIVERNTIYFDDNYVDDIEFYMNTCADGGALYYTLNSRSIARYNVIFSRTSNHYYNNGIYCDDGASGCVLYGNLIINSSASGYDISCRRVSVNDINGEPSDISNKNNVIFMNLLSGVYKFEGRDGGADGCINGSNIIMCGNKYWGRKDEIDVETSYPDYYIYGTVQDGGFVRIPSQYASIVKGLAIDDRVKSRLLFNVY